MEARYILQEGSWRNFTIPGTKLILFQKGSTREMSKYVLFLHSEAGHPPCLNLIETILASNWSWHYELHEDVLGFMWVTLCANWQGFKLTITTKTLIGWFCMGKQHALAYIPNYLIVSLHFFAMIFVCYKDSIPPEIDYVVKSGVHATGN